MNNIRQKNIIYGDNTRNELPYQKYDSLTIQNGQTINDIRLDNIAKQLVNNDLFIENDIYANGGYAVGPKDDTDVKSLFDHAKYYKDDRNGELSIMHKIVSDVSSTTYMDEDVSETVDLILKLNDFEVITTKSGGIKYKDSDGVVKQISVPRTLCFCSDEECLYVGTEQGVYRIKEARSETGYKSIVAEKISSNISASVVSICLDKSSSVSRRMVVVSDGKVLQATVSKTGAFQFSEIGPFVENQFTEQYVDMDMTTDCRTFSSKTPYCATLICGEDGFDADNNVVVGTKGALFRSKAEDQLVNEKCYPLNGIKFTFRYGGVVNVVTSEGLYTFDGTNLVRQDIGITTFSSYKIAQDMTFLINGRNVYKYAVSGGTASVQLFYTNAVPVNDVDVISYNGTSVFLVASENGIDCVDLNDTSSKMSEGFATYSVDQLKVSKGTNSVFAICRDENKVYRYQITDIVYETIDRIDHTVRKTDEKYQDSREVTVGGDAIHVVKQDTEEHSRLQKIDTDGTYSDIIRYEHDLQAGTFYTIVDYSCYELYDKLTVAYTLHVQSGSSNRYYLKIYSIDESGGTEIFSKTISNGLIFGRNTIAVNGQFVVFATDGLLYFVDKTQFSVLSGDFEGLSSVVAVKNSYNDIVCVTESGQYSLVGNHSQQNEFVCSHQRYGGRTYDWFSKDQYDSVIGYCIYDGQKRVVKYVYDGTSTYQLCSEFLIPQNDAVNGICKEINQKTDTTTVMTENGVSVLHDDTSTRECLLPSIRVDGGFMSDSYNRIGYFSDGQKIYNTYSCASAQAYIKSSTRLFGAVLQNTLSGDFQTNIEYTIYGDHYSDGSNVVNLLSANLSTGGVGWLGYNLGTEKTPVNFLKQNMTRKVNVAAHTNTLPYVAIFTDKQVYVITANNGTTSRYSGTLVGTDITCASGQSIGDPIQCRRYDEQGNISAEFNIFPKNATKNKVLYTGTISSATNTVRDLIDFDGNVINKIAHFRNYDTSAYQYDDCIAVSYLNNVKLYKIKYNNQNNTISVQQLTDSSGTVQKIQFDSGATVLDVYIGGLTDGTLSDAVIYCKVSVGGTEKIYAGYDKTELTSVTDERGTEHVVSGFRSSYNGNEQTYTILTEDGIFSQNRIIEGTSNSPIMLNGDIAVLEGGLYRVDYDVDAVQTIESVKLSGECQTVAGMSMLTLQDLGDSNYATYLSKDGVVYYATSQTAVVTQDTDFKQLTSFTIDSGHQITRMYADNDILYVLTKNSNGESNVHPIRVYYSNGVLQESLISTYNVESGRDVVAFGEMQKFFGFDAEDSGFEKIFIQNSSGSAAYSVKTQEYKLQKSQDIDDVCGFFVANGNGSVFASDESYFMEESTNKIYHYGVSFDRQYVYDGLSAQVWNINVANDVMFYCRDGHQLYNDLNGTVGETQFELPSGMTRITNSWTSNSDGTKYNFIYGCDSYVYQNEKYEQFYFTFNAFDIEKPSDSNAYGFVCRSNSENALVVSKNGGKYGILKINYGDNSMVYFKVGSGYGENSHPYDSIVQESDCKDGGTFVFTDSLEGSRIKWKNSGVVARIPRGTYTYKEDVVGFECVSNKNCVAYGNRIVTFDGWDKKSLFKKIGNDSTSRNIKRFIVDCGKIFMFEDAEQFTNLIECVQYGNGTIDTNFIQVLKTYSEDSVLDMHKVEDGDGTSYLVTTPEFISKVRSIDGITYQDILDGIILNRPDYCESFNYSEEYDNYTYSIASDNGILRTEYRYTVKDDFYRYRDEELRMLYQNNVSSFQETVGKCVSDHVNLSVIGHGVSSFIDDINSNIMNVDYSNINISTWQKKGSDDTSDISNDIVYQVSLSNDIGMSVVLENFLRKQTIQNPSVIRKSWASGIDEVYVYIPTTNTYYINHIDGTPCCTKYAQNIQRKNLSEYGYEKATISGQMSSYYSTFELLIPGKTFEINQILNVQANGNSLPLKVYKDTQFLNDEGVAAQYYHSFVEPTVMMKRSISNYGTHSFKFACFGSDAQAVALRVVGKKRDYSIPSYHELEIHTTEDDKVFVIDSMYFDGGGATIDWGDGSAKTIVDGLDGILDGNGDGSYRYEHPGVNSGKSLLSHEYPEFDTKYTIKVYGNCMLGYTWQYVDGIEHRKLLRKAYFGKNLLQPRTHSIYFTMAHCTNLQEVRFLYNPDTIIGVDAASSDSMCGKTLYGMFLECQSLEYADVPKWIKTIGNEAFDGCQSLESVKFGPSLTKFDISYVEENTDCGILEWDFSDCLQVPAFTENDYYYFDRYVQSDDVKFYVPSSLYGEWVSSGAWAHYKSRIYAV